MGRSNYVLKLILMVCTMVIAASCAQQPNQNSQAENDADEAISLGYDEELASELGADDYGMKQYVIAFLKEGPNRDQDSTRAAELQRAHLENIRRLAGEGKLILAGPFMDRDEVRGLFIFDVRTIEEARELTESDPAIQAGRLAMELRPWYGSAALTQLNDIHSTISKIDP